MIHWAFISICMFISQRGLSEFLFKQQLRFFYQNSVPVITANKLNQLLQQNTTLYLLDTRTPPEYGVSHLAGARLINPTDFELGQVADIPPSAPIVVYCTVGVRSEKIGEKLMRAGYPHVQNLYGGLLSWKNQNLPLVDTQGLLTNRVHTYNKYWSWWLQNGKSVYE